MSCKESTNDITFIITLSRSQRMLPGLTVGSTSQSVCYRVMGTVSSDPYCPSPAYSEAVNQLACFIGKETDPEK